jgi:hypothetical protein
MKIKLRRTNLYLTQIQYDEIKRQAEIKQIKFSEMFRKIVDWYLEEKNGKSS